MTRFQKISVSRMLSYWIWLLAVLLSAGKSEISHASDSGIRPLDVICRDWPMPTGYVIVSVEDSQSCLGTGKGSQYTVSLPSEGLTVCNNLSIPAPYVVTTMAPSSKCGGIFDEGTIRSAAEGLSVCGNGFSSVPDGYVVTSASANDVVTCEGVPIYRLGTAGNGVAMCSFSTSPSGYVVSQVNSSNQCIGFNVRILKPVVQGVIGCSFSRLPDGYVVTSGAQTASCTDGDLRGDYWTFTQVYDGVNVCPYSPVPAGYYVTGTVTKTNCYAASFGYLLKKG